MTPTPPAVDPADARDELSERLLRQPVSTDEAYEVFAVMHEAADRIERDAATIARLEAEVERKDAAINKAFDLLGGMDDAAEVRGILLAALSTKETMI